MNHKSLNFFTSHFPGWSFEILESPLTGMTTLMAERGEHTISHTNTKIRNLYVDMLESLIMRMRKDRGVA